MKRFFVYIVECSDTSLYTGVARDVNRRILEHNTSKRGAKSVRGKLPVRLVYSESYDFINEALKREKEIKGWSRIKKLALIGKNALALRHEVSKRG